MININGIGPVLFERSKRARRVIISIRPSTGIRVAVPAKISFKNALEFVHSKKSWIQKHLAKNTHYENERKAIEEFLPTMAKAKAKNKLTGRLDHLAERCGFTYNKATIRNQKTRWGSCSHKNNISLNMKLVRLPDEFMDYVILHELVHTRIHDHGKSFWEELDKYVSNSKVMAKRLRKYELRLM